MTPRFRLDRPLPFAPRGTLEHADVCRRPWPLGLAAAVLVCLGVVPSISSAQGAGAPPDDALLGTVEVDGSGDGITPLPKLGYVPVEPASATERTAQAVVRRDLELSGQYDVLPLEKLPETSAARDAAIDLVAYRAKGAEVVVRVRYEPRPDGNEVVGELFDTRGASAGAPAKPLFATGVKAKTDADVRAAAHRVTDALLGAGTGRPGPFESRLVYTKREGKWTRVHTIDPDGENDAPASPLEGTVLSPAFGPSGVLYYVMSQDFAPFRVAAGPKATFLPIDVPGSVMGIAISPDKTRAALTVMRDGKSSVLIGEGGKLTTLDAAPFAHHPTFGPLGKVAYVGGAPVQRVHVDGKAVSPPGFMASSPTFCDTTHGLWIVFTVEVQGGAELVATDSSGGNMRRLTQRQGENRYPACSPDGRLVAFFSTTKAGQGPGLYLMPVGRPWLAKKVSSDVGQGLQWERVGRP